MTVCIFFHLAVFGNEQFSGMRVAALTSADDICTDDNCLPRSDLLRRNLIRSQSLVDCRHHKQPCTTSALPSGRFLSSQSATIGHDSTCGHMTFIYATEAAKPLDAAMDEAVRRAGGWASISRATGVANLLEAIGYSHRSSAPSVDRQSLACRKRRNIIWRVLLATKRRGERKTANYQVWCSSWLTNKEHYRGSVDCIGNKYSWPGHLGNIKRHICVIVPLLQLASSTNLISGLTLKMKMKKWK